MERRGDWRGTGAQSHSCSAFQHSRLAEPAPATFHEATQKLLDDVDEAKQRVLEFMADTESCDAVDLWDSVGLNADYIDAALYELYCEGVVALERGDTEFRELTGATFRRVARIAERSRSSSPPILGDRLVRRETGEEVNVVALVTLAAS